MHSTFTQFTLVPAQDTKELRLKKRNYIYKNKIYNLFSKCAILESCGRSSAVMDTANTMLSTCDALSTFHILDD